MAKPVTSSAAHLDYLDGWRGLAIASLLLGHFFPVDGINFGHVGVDLFFVLSGFLMSRLLFLNGTALPLFYKRRVSRVFPTFFIFLLCILLLTSYVRHPIDWWDVSMAALFINNYFPASHDAGGLPFGHIWSLAVEEQSYVLLSIVALAVRYRWLKALSGLGLLVVLCIVASLWHWRHDDPGLLEFAKFYHTEMAGYGIVISGFLLLLLDGRTTLRLPAWCYPALGMTALLFFWWRVPVALSLIVGVGLLALLLNLLPNAPTSVQRLLQFYPLRQLGLWSFSIYLWQQPFYLARYHHQMPAWLAMLSSLGLGIGSYYLLEQPIRNYLNRHWAKPAATAELHLPAAGQAP